MRAVTRLTVLLACAVLTMAFAGETARAAEIDDHPLVSRYAGSIPSRQDVEEFQNYPLITKVIADSLEFESLELSGRLTRTNYNNPGDRSPLEILANYEQAIIGAGGTIVYNCREKECGPSYAGSRWNRFNGTLNLPGVGGYLAGRVSAGDNVAYIAVAVAKRRHQITVVEVQEMETGLVDIDPDALGEELDRLGHVAIPGVYFETGKAVLTPESEEALEAMAAILNGRPGMSVWIVGHTDWQGGFRLNADLSAARAKAVADALTRTHKIAADRLEGHGVGPLVPAASNATEPGRAVNRRVELVVRP